MDSLELAPRKTTAKTTAKVAKKPAKKSKIGWPDAVVAYTDGASRGNPGPAAMGILFCTDAGEKLLEIAQELGTQTNNFAEYSAVLKALEVAKEKGASGLTIRSDSELMVRQMSGIYKVKSESIRPLFEACQNKAREIGLVRYEHVRREQNKEADALANRALDFGDMTNDLQQGVDHLDK